MRGPLIAVALLAGCVEQHPAWEGATTGESTSGPPTTTSGTASTASSSTGASSSGGETGTSAPGTDGSTGPATATDTAGGSTGGVGSTGGQVGHRIFITSQVWTGEFGSLAAADALCQSAADAEQLGGTWKAILSDGTTDARDRITVSGPVENTQGDLVAADEAELWGGMLQSPIQYTEQGINSSGVAWTGTDDNGVALNFHCNDWAPVDNNDKGWSGDPTATDLYWTYANWQFCLGDMRSLYCISQ